MPHRTIEPANQQSGEPAGLRRARDASDPGKRTVPGYAIFEAYVRVRRWQLFPLLMKPLRTYSGAPTSKNKEIWGHLRRVHKATEGRGAWVRDRGFDRRELLLPMLRLGMAFIVRQRGDRNIVIAGKRELVVEQRVAELSQSQRPLRWSSEG